MADLLPNIPLPVPSPVPHAAAHNPIILDAYNAVATKPIIQTVTDHVTSGVSLMEAFLAVIIAMAIAGTVGYFVGKRGITNTQTDLQNAIKQIQNLPQTIQTAPTTVEHDVEKHLPKL